jgi:hypothetical protein
MRLLQPCVCYTVPLWRMSMNLVTHSGSVLFRGSIPAFIEETEENNDKH